MGCGCPKGNNQYGGIKRPPLSYKAGGKSPKASMSCGQVKRSTRPGKKIMKLYCIDGKKKLVHAGAKGYGHNYSAAARKSFKARHKCSTAKPGTAKHLACTELWAGKGGSKKSSPRGRKGKYAVGGPYLNMDPYNPLNESNFDITYKGTGQGEMGLSDRQQRRIKRRQTGRNIGATAYGVLEGVLDTLTFGATDKFTDMGYEALAGLGREQSAAREARQKKYRTAGQTAGAFTTAAFTGQYGSAIGTTDFDEFANEESKGLQNTLKAASTVAGVAVGNTNAAGDLGKLANTDVGNVLAKVGEKSSFGGTGTGFENLAQTYAPNLKEGISSFQEFKELNPDAKLGEFLQQNPEMFQKVVEALGMGSGTQVNKYGGPISYRTGGPTNPPYVAQASSTAVAMPPDPRKPIVYGSGLKTYMTEQQRLEDEATKEIEYASRRIREGRYRPVTTVRDGKIFEIGPEDKFHPQHEQYMQDLRLARPFDYLNTFFPSPESYKYGGGLRRWFKEKWVDVKTGKPCGRSGKEKTKRGYPYCRPSRKVSSKTPATSKHPEARSRAKQKTGPGRVKPISQRKKK